MGTKTSGKLTKTSITDKDWLELAWKHFQQHAQQRIQYFNYFVVFSTILLTGLVSTFQNNFHTPYLGIGIGLIQSFLAFIFLKIDERNSLLTKHAEKIIMQIEADYENWGYNSYKLFTSEIFKTNNERDLNKYRFFLRHHFSHGRSYRIIYITFAMIGIIGTTISFFNFSDPNPDIIDNDNKESTFQFPIDRIDSLNNLILNHEAKLNLTQKEMKQIELEIDTIQQIVKSEKHKKMITD